MTGGVPSTTLMLKPTEPVLPLESVALQATCVVPIAKVEPDAGVHDPRIVPLTASVAVGANVTVAPAELVATAVISPIGPNAGAVVSTTVTVKAPLAVLPAWSIALHVTVLVPSANVLPGAAEQITAT